MYRKTAYEIGMLFLMIFLFVSVSGCMISTGISTGNTSSGPPPWAHGNRANHHYRYYTYDNIYFDEQQGVYFYLYDGRWQTSVSLPSSIRITVNNFVTLDMDTDKPYVYHNDVLKRYPPGQQKKRDQEINRDNSQEQDKDQRKAQDADKNKSQGENRNKSQVTDRNKAQETDKNKRQDKAKDKSKDKDKDLDKDQDKSQDKKEDNN